MLFRSMTKFSKFKNFKIRRKNNNFEKKRFGQKITHFQKRTKYLVPLVFSEDNISKMKLKQNYQVIFTGHSLGAAVSANMLVMASLKGYINKEKNLPILITFGQPRTGNKLFIEKLNDFTEMIIRNVNDNDLVSQIPLYDEQDEDTYVHSNGELRISGTGTDISSDNTIYIDNDFKDSQKMNYLQILGNAIKNQSKHSYYYGVEVGPFCGK